VRRRSALHGGATRVGWKLGLGERESIGGAIAIGHLTSATVLEPGSSYAVPPGADLHADAEIAVELAAPIDPEEDVAAIAPAIAGFGTALEIVDLAGPPHDAAWAVATNVFHRAVAIGPSRPTLPRGAEARIEVDGVTVAVGRAAADVAGRLEQGARLLDAVGERFEAGDRIITGSIVQVSIAAGNDVVAAVAGLGRSRLAVVETYPPAAA
jgi:2-keto-4-pentenoate hydratase